MELCEWNPEEDCPATGSVWNEPEHHRGCKREAVLSVGKSPENWHLCEECAALPHFKRLRLRIRLRQFSRPLPTRGAS